MANKMIVALVASLGILGSVLSDGQVSPSEWVEVVLAGLNPFVVFGVSNAPPAPRGPTPRRQPDNPVR